MYLKCILMSDSVVWIQLDQNMVPVARYGGYCNETIGHIKEAKLSGQHVTMDAAPVCYQSHFLH
jgi:hypothetical protein